MPEELKDGNENPEKNDVTETDKSGEENKDKKEEKEDNFQRKIDEPENKNKEKKSSDNESVPLKKHLSEKLRRKEAEKTVAELKTQLSRFQSGNNSINSKDLDALAEEFGANPEALKKLASILTPKQTADLEDKIAKLEESNKLLLAKDQRRDQEKQFDKHFKEKIASKYPELKEKKSLFKQVWFSPTFPNLKTLEDIRKEFFPHIKAVETKDGVKKESIESGNGGTNKGAKIIDFSKMTDEQHIEVLKDPELKAKYYKWLDTKS